MWDCFLFYFQKKPLPHFCPSVHLSRMTGGRPGVWSRKQTGVQVCDVWHAHAAWDHHREETGLTAASPWPWLHYLLARCWRSRERPTCTTKHPWDLDAKATEMNIPIRVEFNNVLYEEESQVTSNMKCGWKVFGLYKHTDLMKQLGCWGQAAKLEYSETGRAFTSKG